MIMMMVMTITIMLIVMMTVMPMISLMFMMLTIMTAANLDAQTSSGAPRSVTKLPGPPADTRNIKNITTFKR